MKKIYKIITAYISSKNNQESLRYENQLLAIIIVPLLLLGAVLNLVLFNLFSTDNSILTLKISGGWLLFVAAMYLISKLKISERVKSYFVIILMALLTCFFILIYYQMIGPAVWSYAGITIIIAMTRNDRVMVFVTSAVVVLLGLHMASHDYSYTIGALYYVAQFIAVALLTILALCVQKLNAERYKKIRYYLNESEMISQLSAELISVNADNLDEKVQSVLEKCTQYYNVERSSVLLLSKDQQKLTFTHEWQVGSIKHEPQKNKTIDMLPMWMNRLEDKSVWFLSNIDMMKDDKSGEKEALQQLNLKSVISIPIINKDKVIGTLFFESFTKYVDWKEEHNELLVLFTHMLADALVKVEAEKEINYLAFYDSLTGLSNRSHFNMQLERAIESARKYKTRLAVMYIDLDSFKAVNDMIGHEGGDELLRQVGITLREHMGDHGIVGRLGGDEFIVLIPNISVTDNIEEFADHVMNVFKEPMIVDNQEFFVTVSAGVAVYPYDGLDSKTLRKNADHAMYKAKELGKNQVAVCTPKIKKDIEKNVLITNLLHRALEKNELSIHYQPLVDIASKEIVGFEALLRWMQPELGFIPPNVFIPLAEQTGLIFPIGKWALKTACRQNKAWQDAGCKPIRMAVNLSIEQFRRADLVDMIKEVLDETGLAPEYLELEITESVASKETNFICGLLSAIRALGVSISIDDFGTEYSSLARIKHLPIDRIKMAMEFVHGIAISDKDEAIARIIINLARNLGLKVIAEGVETEGQLEFLRSLVCDEVQGYYFYKPMPAKDIEMILRHFYAPDSWMSASV